MPLVDFTPYETNPSTKLIPNIRAQGDANDDPTDNAKLIYGIAGSDGTTDAHPDLVDGTDKALDSDRLGFNFSSSTVISVNDWREIVDQINNERGRRGYATMGVGVRSAINADAKINHEHFNIMRNGINVASVGVGDKSYEGSTPASLALRLYLPAPAVQTSSEAVQNGVIYASDVNKLVADVNTAGRACVCNCNYCSCNCNYCTCNCNYSCTCNCNY